MNAAHRDRLAYARIVSGEFDRGMVVTHATTGKPFATKYAQAVFGRDVSSIEHAYPGDIVGFVNAQSLRVGVTVYVGDKIEFPQVPSSAPEHFITAPAADIARSQTFRRGIEQLHHASRTKGLPPHRRANQTPVPPPHGPITAMVVQA